MNFVPYMWGFFAKFKIILILLNIFCVQREFQNICLLNILKKMKN